MTLCASLVLSCIMGVQVFAQGGYEVKGVVVDQVGPVIGATVIEQGTTNGASTGLDGDFILKVSGQTFAAGFLQIPPHDGHPCLWLCASRH